MVDPYPNAGPVSIFESDFMHVYFVNGIFVWEYNALMSDLAAFGLGHSTFSVL